MVNIIVNVFKLALYPATTIIVVIYITAIGAATNCIMKTTTNTVYEFFMLPFIIVFTARIAPKSKTVFSYFDFMKCFLFSTVFAYLHNVNYTILYIAGQV